MKKRVSAFPTNALQNMGLLLAFVLLMAANGFTGDRPVLAAVLVFVFSLSYLLASVVTRRARLLYATMLLGTVSYYLACNSMGASSGWFPLLSVPLVAALLAVGHHLKRRLSDELAGSYSATLFRAMNVTTVFFSLWALVQVGKLTGEAGPLRYVAALTFLGYAGVYLLHSVAVRKGVYVYAFSAALTAGSAIMVAVAWRGDVAWLAAVASAGLILLVGTKTHRDGQFTWSRHFHFAAAAAIFVSLGLALLRWPFVVVDLALVSLLLWAAYGWLSKAVPNVLNSRVADRVVAKFFFLGSVAMALPVAVMIFITPTDPYIVLASLICGASLCWLVWQRRDDVVAQSNVRYALGASMFISAGLLGVAGQFPAVIASAWAVGIPLLLLAALVWLRSLLDQTKHQSLRSALAGAAVFPVLFAWYVPVLQGEWQIGLIAAGAALVAVVALSFTKALRSCVYGVGPALAGVVICLSLLLRGESVCSWGTCAAAAALAGVLLICCNPRVRTALRGAANLAWLILSLAAVIIAARMGLGMVPLLYAATAVGAVAALVAARASRAEGSDIFDRFVQIVALGATATAVMAGSFGDVGGATVGLCVLILAAAHWLAWAWGRSASAVRLAIGLLALGGLLVIFGVFPPVETRLVHGALLAAGLFALAALTNRRSPVISGSAVAVGHLTSVVLAMATLILAWAADVDPMLMVGGGVMVLAYGLLPTFRSRPGLRTGAALWLSFVVLAALAWRAETVYPLQVNLLVFLSLIWLVAGWMLAKTKAKGWSVPLYVAAAIVAGLCSIVTMFAPAVDGSWVIFLVSGLVFASLLVLLRADVFAYLLTLSLSFMAYDWAKAGTSHFTQDILFYLILGGAALTAAFFLPVLWRALGRTGLVPIFALFTRRGAILLAVVLLACAALLASTYTLELTGHPKFCISCHNMDEYYASWEHSTHQDVKCIKCHYEPGVTSTIKGKIGGLVQVVQYVSHAYDSNPEAIVSNSSCMRAACHWEVGISEEASVLEPAITFRHDKHLGEPSRGMDLNCVTCHGQVVEDEHMSVAKTTCMTCHFYGREEQSVAVGDCQTCHALPDEPVAFMGKSFDHAFVERNDVECSHCHSQVTEGRGAVSATRCNSCHLGEQMADVTDQEAFHLVHVSQEHVNCLQCHDQTEHGTSPMAQRTLAGDNCESCHTGQRHSVQERVYAGTAIAEADVNADVMYKAGVACEGCHTEVEANGSDATAFTMLSAGPEQCVSCHGQKRYGTMLADWQEMTEQSIAQFQAAVDELAGELASADAPADDMERAGELLASARMKLACVVDDGSLGAHNYPYLEDLLFSVEEQIDDCRSLMKSWNQQAQAEGGE